MAIWVCRTGLNGQYAEDFLKDNKIYLTRDNLSFDLGKAKKSFVINSLYSNSPAAARQTIYNTWSQIDIFANRMSIGDIVIIPKKSSTLVSVGVIKGNYIFSERAVFPYVHSREIKVLSRNIDTTDFSQNIKYSLDAFRTIFSIRQEDEIRQLLIGKGVCFNEV